MKCPKCSSKMVEGKVLYSYDEGRAFSLRWSRYIGKKKVDGLFGTKEKEAYEVGDVYGSRCESCNHLEFKVKNINEKV